MSNNNLKLAVDVVRAHNLLPRDGQGSTSAAVELIFDGQKFRTTIKERDLNPFWNETFYFNVDLHTLTLEAHLHSINKATDKKHFLGKVRINGTSFVPFSDAVVFNYPLEKHSLFSAARGELALKVYLTGDAAAASSSIHLRDSSSTSSSSLHSIHEEAVSDRPPPNGKTRPRRTFHTLSSGSNVNQQPRASSSIPSSSYQTAHYGCNE